MVNYGPQSVRVRHVRGVNVLYANGSAKWVALDQFINNTDTSADAWRKIPPAIGNGAETSTSSTHNNAMLNELSKPKTGVWRIWIGRLEEEGERGRVGRGETSRLGDKETRRLYSADRPLVGVADHGDEHGEDLIVFFVEGAG